MSLLSKKYFNNDDTSEKSGFYFQILKNFDKIRKFKYGRLDIEHSNINNIKKSKDFENIVEGVKENYKLNETNNLEEGIEETEIIEGNKILEGIYGMDGLQGFKGIEGLDRFQRLDRLEGLDIREEEDYENKNIIGFNEENDFENMEGFEKLRKVNEEMTEYGNDGMNNEVNEEMTEYGNDRMTEEVNDGMNKDVNEEITEEVNDGMTEEVNEEITEKVNEDMTDENYRNKLENSEGIKGIWKTFEEICPIEEIYTMNLSESSLVDKELFPEEQRSYENTIEESGKKDENIEIDKLFGIEEVYREEEFYGIDKINLPINIEININIIRKKICYCRVNSYSQKIDLECQIEYMKNKYPTHEILSDIGISTNFNRYYLKKIINYGIKNELEELVISCKDILCKTGYELIENILKEYSNTIIIIEKENLKSLEVITDDLIEIITNFRKDLSSLVK